MSFEKYIDTLQKKSRKEQKVFVLIITSIVFLAVMAVLFKFGAFTLSSKTSTVESKGSFFEIKEELSDAMAGFDDELDDFASSTTDIMQIFKDLASSTESNATNTEEYMFSTSSKNNLIPLLEVPNEEEIDDKIEVVTEEG